MRASFILSFTLPVLVATGCPDEGKRPIGANCTSHEECQSGVCGGGVCLDPDGDEDLDGLVNKIEASLATNPVIGDTDADGKADADEVGALEAPTDSDGDGKIDAVESASRDVDADCIPDELDKNDAFSDPESDTNPNACGNGKPYPDGGGDGGGKELCKTLETYLGGTCARDLGTALVVCFDPSGCMRPDTSTEGLTRIVFENGAYIETDDDGETLRMYSSKGQLCTEADMLSNSETEVVFAYRASGKSWTVTVQVDDGTSDLRCEDGTVVHLSAQGSAAVSACQGTRWEYCDGVIPKQCTSSADCVDGQTCCDLGEVDYCLPAEQCPQR